MPDPRYPEVHGYVLAGGQSSRMGTDKALLPFGASTLLKRAVASLHVFCSDVTVVGRILPAGLERDPTADFRAIPDHIIAAGPVAGVVAALTDLAARKKEWAFFLPVDVPLLPAELLNELVPLWLGNPLTRVAFPVADERPQPVISLVHVTALHAMREALAHDQRRLRAALEDAAAQLAQQLQAPRAVILQTPRITVREGTVLADDHPLAWQPTPRQMQTATLWFANANTPVELDQLRIAATHPQPGPATCTHLLTRHTTI